MNIASPDHDAVDDVPGDDGLALELPDHGTGARRARRARRSGRSRQGEERPPLAEPGPDQALEGAADADAVHGAGDVERVVVDDQVDDSSIVAESPSDDTNTATSLHTTDTAVEADDIAAGPTTLGWRQRALYVVCVCLLAAAIPALGYGGIRSLSGSTDGRRVAGSLAPDDPNFEAIVEPTPTLLVVDRDGDDVVAITLLTLGRGEQGGGVLFVPVGTVVGASDDGSGGQTLAAVFSAGGLPALRQTVAELVGTGLGEAIELDAARWAQLVAPVTPIRLDNPDDVVVDTSPRDVAFEAGELELSDDEVAEFLDTEGIGQSDLARLARHEAFFTAWFTAVADATDQQSAVPGEVESGIGRFVRGLAAGLSSHQVDFATLPVDELEGDREQRFVVQPAAMVELMSRLVPLPTSPAAAPSPLARVRVRVLLGTTGAALVDTSIRQLVPAGAQIVLVGNADSFGYDATLIEYGEAGRAAAAERLKDALGAGEVSQVDTTDETYDVTVVLGRDYAGPHAPADDPADRD